MAVPFVNSHPENKLWFILYVLVVLALVVVLVHHGLEKAHQIYGITPNETQDGNRTDDIIYWTYNVTTQYHLHITNKDTGKVFDNHYPVIEVIACGDVNGRRDLFVVEFHPIVDKSVISISDVPFLLGSGTTYVNRFECIENCQFDPEMEKKCWGYSPWDDLTDEELCGLYGGRWNGSDCRVPTGGRWSEKPEETSIDIPYQTANSYIQVPLEMRGELECVAKCNCWGERVGSGSSCDLCTQECLFERELAYEYLTLISDVFHKHPFVVDVWDCSNISWDVMVGLQGRGYAVWYCGGFYRNNTSEAHAWLIVKEGNKSIPLDSGVIIPDEIYNNDYQLVKCSNKTYFDVVTNELDEK